MKKILLVTILLTTLTGCGASTEEKTSEVSEASSTEASSFEENVTGGTEVQSLSTSEMVITDTNEDGILDPVEDDTVDSLADSGFEYSVKVFDTDGDGVVSDENDANEMYTTVINLKNTSGRDIEVSDFQLYLQSADDDEPIEMTYIDSGDMDSSKFVLGESDGNYVGYIKYIDDETYDQFTFPKDTELTIVTTQSVSVAVDSIEPAELSFIALNEDGISYYVEATSEFAAE